MMRMLDWKECILKISRIIADAILKTNDDPGTIMVKK